MPTETGGDGQSPDTGQADSLERQRLIEDLTFLVVQRFRRSGPLEIRGGVQPTAKQNRPDVGQR